MFKPAADDKVVTATSRLLDCLANFREFDPDMDVLTAAVFLYVASHPGCTARDIREYLKVTPNAVNQNLRNLGELHYSGKKPGLMLVQRRPNGRDPRFFEHDLTAQGRIFAQLLTAKIQGGKAS